VSEARGAGAKSRVGTVINGKWRIEARIGSGGMATVYAARHRNGHRAALKMLHGQLSRDPSTRARFLREGYVANAVGHPGVVAVLDDGVAEDGSAYLVLELLEGETVDARRLRLGGMLSMNDVVEIADQALDALAAAHDKGIVHRDIKPENVFVTTDGQVKLLDFGLARMKDVQAEATKTGVTIGTPEFMPPEQARGRRDAVDPRSDVWGLGATLFTLITGRYVHDDAQSIHEQLMAAATRRPKPIRQVAPHVPPAIAKVIDRALELEMDDRWPSARDMQAALRAARAGARAFDPDSATIATSKLAQKALSRSSSDTIDASPTQKTLHVGGGPARSFEDATDMEETFVEKGRAQKAPAASDPSRPILDPDEGETLANPLGARAPHGPLEAPTPLQVVTNRMPRRAQEPSPRAVARASARPPPARERALVEPPVEQTPTQRAEGLPKLAPAPDDDANAPTVAVASPRKLEVAGKTQVFAPPAPSPSAPPPPSPHSFPLASAPPPPLFGEPPLGPPSAPPPANPLSVPPPAPGPPAAVPGPSEAPEGGAGRVIVFVSLVLIAFCTAMAAYVLWRGNLPPSR
jgi:serine/threonine-protein kinase